MRYWRRFPFGLELQLALICCDLISYTGGTVLDAGSDTSAAFLQSFMFCLVASPEVQTRAHREINEVVGRDRSPRFEDFENLPYLDAIIKEVNVMTLHQDDMLIRFRSTDSDLLPQRGSLISPYRMKL